MTDTVDQRPPSREQIRSRLTSLTKASRVFRGLIENAYADAAGILRRLSKPIRKSDSISPSMDESVDMLRRMFISSEIMVQQLKALAKVVATETGELNEALVGQQAAIELEGALLEAAPGLSELLVRVGRPKAGFYGYEDLAATLKAMRETSGLTQQQLADDLGQSKTQVSHLENYSRDRRPPIDVVKKWAEACGYRFELTFTRLKSDEDPLAAADDVWLMEVMRLLLPVLSDKERLRMMDLLDSKRPDVIARRGRAFSSEE